tara:strand:+ start:19438 stop:20163 length:726 start_codon:yes stop_codon:yes gene_type:complete
MNKKKLLIVGNRGRLQGFLCTALANDFELDFSGCGDSVSDSCIQEYDLILYSGGEVRNPDVFMNENFHAPYLLFLRASKLNIRFVFFSSLASLYYIDVLRFDSMKGTDYRLYAESKYLCDQAINSHENHNACSLKLASINHPVRISSSYQKYLSSSKAAKVAMQILGTYISYCTYHDILMAVTKALNDSSQRSITVSTSLMFWGRLGKCFRPLLRINIRKVPRHYYTRLYFVTMPNLCSKY